MDLKFPSDWSLDDVHRDSPIPRQHSKRAAPFATSPAMPSLGPRKGRDKNPARHQPPLDKPLHGNLENEAEIPERIKTPHRL